MSTGRTGVGSSLEISGKHKYASHSAGGGERPCWWLRESWESRLQGPLEYEYERRLLRSRERARERGQLKYEYEHGSSRSREQEQDWEGGQPRETHYALDWGPGVAPGLSDNLALPLRVAHTTVVLRGGEGALASRAETNLVKSFGLIPWIPAIQMVLESVPGYFSCLLEYGHSSHRKSKTNMHGRGSAPQNCKNTNGECETEVGKLREHD
ncbi:hypothetical protein EDD16DRAFT_1725721 [Pisolithus croceorrhizus]|nr:hypothetical protein EDD16DRAFT_1725721 [Pisolithus croceorrhizus]